MAAERGARSGSSGARLQPQAAAGRGPILRRSRLGPTRARGAGHVRASRGARGDRGGVVLVPLLCTRLSQSADYPSVALRPAPRHLSRCQGLGARTKPEPRSGDSEEKQRKPQSPSRQAAGDAAQPKRESARARPQRHLQRRGRPRGGGGIRGRNRGGVLAACWRRDRGKREYRPDRSPPSRSGSPSRSIPNGL